MTMERLLTIQEKARANRATITGKLMTNMKKMTKRYSKKQIATLNDVVASAPIFHLINDNQDFKNIIKGKTNVDTLIKEIEKGMDKKDIDMLKRMANMLTGDDYKPSKNDNYNIHATLKGKAIRGEYERLVALYSLNNIEGKEEAFDILNRNVDLFNLISDVSAGIKDLHNSIFDGSIDEKRYRENIVDDIYSENNELVAITNTDYLGNKYPESAEWKILRTPTSTEYGIAYRSTKYETFQEGTGSNVTHRTPDVVIDPAKKMKNAKNVVRVDVGNKQKINKLILTKAEKEELGLIKDPAETLYRTFARLNEISDTQIARDVIISEGITEKISTKDKLAEFDRELGKQEAEERKWTVKLPQGITVRDATEKIDGKYKYPNIARYYTAVDHASNVKGFRNNLDLVRKDVKPWLLGYKDYVLAPDHPRLKRLLYTWRGLIKLAKVKMVVLSPMKIFNDAVSNSAILLSNGISPVKIARYSKKALEDIEGINELILSQMEAKIKGQTKRAEVLSRRIKKHPGSILLNNGMMQSINTDILDNDTKLVSGLQKDIEDILDVITKTKDKKELTDFAEAIKSLSQAGYSVEGLMKFAGSKLENFKYVEKLGKKIREEGERISGIASSGEISRYISEFAQSPASGSVQFGSALVHNIDIVSRSVLLRHLSDKGVPQDEAIIETIDTFINYKQNMPREVKLLSDYGILMFPSFWLRIQKVILSLLAKRVGGYGLVLGGEEISSEFLHVNIEDIFESNIFEKVTGNFGIFNEPPVFGFFQ